MDELFACITSGAVRLPRRLCAGAKYQVRTGDHIACDVSGGELLDLSLKSKTGGEELQRVDRRDPRVEERTHHMSFQM